MNKYIAVIKSDYVYGAHTDDEEFFSDLDEFGEEVAYENKDKEVYGYRDISGPMLLGIVEAISEEEALEIATEDFMLPKGMIEIQEI